MKADDLDSRRFVLDVKAAGDLRAKLKQDPQAGLKQAAQQFEGMLLQMMLKSMRDATPQDGLLDSDQTRFYTSIMDQQVAQSLSAKGQLGFAKLIEQQLGRTLNAPQAGGGEAAAMEAISQALMQRRAASSADALPEALAVPNAAPPSPATSASTATGGAAAAGKPREFANRVWPHAVEAAAATGIPARFLVAHAALETGWGKSEIRGADGTPSYNLFGVKAGRSWNGPTVEVQTTEYVNGVAQSSREKFRAYGSYGEAFQDYAALLSTKSRFAGVVGQQDGMQFARALQQSGYATDPLYADKLGRIINGNTLRQALVG